MSGEVMHAEDRALSLLKDGGSVAWRDMLLAVTDERLIWVVLEWPIAEAISMRHDEIVRASYDGDTLRLMLGTSFESPGTQHPETAFRRGGSGPDSHV